MSVVITTNAGEVAKQLNMSAREIRVVMAEAMRDAARYAQKDFERTTATWTHKPEFTVTVETRGTTGEAMIGTDDKIYGYVDQGVKAHPIFPRKKKALAFWTGFHAKSTPGSLQAGAGGVFGERIVRAAVLHWPGIRPRHFTKKIQQRLDAYTPHAIRKYFDRWAKKGHL